MTRSKLGRRVSALLLSALLLSVSVLPAFATSTSGQLQEVGWAETVSSFLMASGIYPFESDSETGYEEWSVSSLKALWDEFRDDTTQVAYDIVDLTGSLAKGVIAIASGRWSVLREFATWIVNKYNVTDNQTGVELGEKIGKFPVFPAVSSNNYASLRIYLGSFVSGGVEYYRYYGGVSVSSPPVYFCYIRPSFSGETYILYISSASFVAYYSTDTVSSGAVGSPSTKDSVSLTSTSAFWVRGERVTATVSGVPLYAGGTYSDDCARMAWTDILGDIPELQGITADTTTVSIPAPLPSGTDFGGLAVSGAGVAVTPEQLEEIVQNAVKEALKPSVAVVPVALSPDVSVNPSGEITLSGDVTIDPGNIPLQPSDYSAPNLSKVFPFSIPWDVLAVLSALDAEPVRPEFNVDLYIPVLDVHVPWTIGVSEALQEPVDSFMASMRLLLLVAMCAGTLWLFWRSNL